MATFADLKPDAAELQQRVERFHAVREGIVKQGARGDRGAGRSFGPSVDRALRGRSLSDHRPSRHRRKH